MLFKKYLKYVTEFNRCDLGDHVSHGAGNMAVSASSACKAVFDLHTDTVQLALISLNHRLNVHTEALKVNLNALKCLLFHTRYLTS